MGVREMKHKMAVEMVPPKKWISITIRKLSKNVGAQKEMPLGWHSASKKHKITLRLKTSVKIADIVPLHKKN